MDDITVYKSFVARELDITVLFYLEEAIRSHDEPLINEVPGEYLKWLLCASNTITIAYRLGLLSWEAQNTINNIIEGAFTEETMEERQQVSHK